MKYKLYKIDNENINNYKELFDDLPLIIKDRINKFKNSKRKIESIVGYSLVRILLKEKNVEFKDIYFNEYGKPYIKDNPIYFNISHSHKYVTAAISDKEIGIDIEKIRTVNIKSTNQIATIKEKEYISTNQKKYFEIYTLKEAYFKSLGTNLNNILNIEFIIDDDKIMCNDNNCNAYFLNLLDDYVISYVERK